MVIVSSLLPNYPGVVPSNQLEKLPFQIQRCNRIRFNDRAAVQPVERIPSGGFHYFLAKCPSNKWVNSVGRDYNQSTFNDAMPEEPFWISLIKEAITALKSLIIFLVEQPSQLKYIEWPGFQSTLKTATLTLVLVALLIVALSSVDSALSLLLALLLRKTP
ncbi:Protein translocase complex, SecE/Sec61-gamma subunit [Melia azedarach]|uniref:Protein translocase complex, SecE/Sec61-gamma subunit n=1 Tax=Melia azedarach TaxID=155640 RepID=A0ACC1XWV5_MELAZ|nr:Protein translocase complex, SecE/Sec61-gamma subunit [Melia azedarach]